MRRSARPPEALAVRHVRFERDRKRSIHRFGLRILQRRQLRRMPEVSFAV
jgi:hypothetical protein